MTTSTSTTTSTPTPTTSFVTITKLGGAGYTGTEVTIPFNGDMFEFLPMSTVALCRRAACAEGGTLREGGVVARVWLA